MGQLDDHINVQVNPPMIELSNRITPNIKLETSQQLDTVVGEWVRPAAVSDLFSFHNVSSASHVPALQHNMLGPTSNGFLNQVATIQNENGEFRIEVRPMNRIRTLGIE